MQCSSSPRAAANGFQAHPSSRSDPSGVDLIGTPDLIVDEKSTEDKWRIKTETLAANLGCTLATDPLTGLCHNFAEASYANNIGRAKIYIPASGPAGPYRNEKDPTASDEIEHAGR